MNEDVPICHCAEYYGSHAPDCPIAAEVRALRADVVWILKSDAYASSGPGHWISFDTGPDTGDAIEYDGTDADIRRAVREARTK